jgi:hypothetical protein
LRQRKTNKTNGPLHTCLFISAGRTFQRRSCPERRGALSIQFTAPPAPPRIEGREPPKQTVSFLLTGAKGPINRVPILPPRRGVIFSSSHWRRWQPNSDRREHKSHQTHRNDQLDLLDPPRGAGHQPAQPTTGASPASTKPELESESTSSRGKIVLLRSQLGVIPV